MLGLGLSLTGLVTRQASRPSEELINEALANTNTLNNHTLVTLIRMDDVTSPAAPSVTVTGISVTIEGSIASVYVGVQAAAGDAYDAESLTQMFFGGNPGVTQAATAFTQSDIADFEWNGTDNLIFSMHTGATNTTVRNRSLTNYADLYYLSGADQASTTDKTGYTLLSNNIFCVRGITVYG